jgi:hypothetical protein
VSGSKFESDIIGSQNSDVDGGDNDKDNNTEKFGELRSSVSIVTGYGLDGQGSIPDRGRGFFLYPLRPDRLWGPPSLLYNGYRGLFPQG